MNDVISFFIRQTDETEKRTFLALRAAETIRSYFSERMVIPSEISVSYTVGE